MKIKAIKAFEILDSRGTPTIAALIETDDDFKEIGFVPSGASTGSREAIEKRDGGNNFNGKGVAQVIKNAEENLFPELIGMKIGSQVEFDSKLIELDGTKNKKNFGANIILSLSLAYCKLSASLEKKPLYEYIHKSVSLSSSFFILANYVRGSTGTFGIGFIQTCTILVINELPFYVNLFKLSKIDLHVTNMINTGKNKINMD